MLFVKLVVGSLCFKNQLMDRLQPPITIFCIYKLYFTPFGQHFNIFWNKKIFQVVLRFSEWYLRNSHSRIWHSGFRNPWFWYSGVWFSGDLHLRIQKRFSTCFYNTCIAYSFLSPLINKFDNLFPTSSNTTHFMHQKRRNTICFWNIYYSGPIKCLNINYLFARIHIGTRIES